MKAWVELYKAHQELRERAGDCGHELRRELKRISERHADLFESNVQERLQRQSKTGGLVKYQLNGDDGEYIATDLLPEPIRFKVGLKEATLQINILMKRNHLRELDLRLTGTTVDGGPWTIAIHIPDDETWNHGEVEADRQGLGACSHPALHCHVGPTLEHAPKVRVPLPPMKPAELLSWLVSQIIPTCEPAGWSEVVKEL